MKTMQQYHVAIAAEAFAAGMFAQAGCNVLVQYGANQPQYDLVVVSAKQTIWVSVKGTQGHAWGLMARYKKDRGYHEAIDAWATANHSSQIIYCLVSLQGIKLGECPRVYLATVAEISKRLKESRNGAGHTILWENRCYTKGIAKGCTDMLPTEWSFTHDRLTYIFETFGAETAFASKPRSD